MSPAARVEVVRSGGIAGITVRASLDTSDLPPEEAKAVEDLLGRIDLSVFPPPGRRAGAVDRYQYDLVVTRDDQSVRVSVGEAEVTPELRELIRRVLAQRSGGPGRAAGG